MIQTVRSQTLCSTCPIANIHLPDGKRIKEDKPASPNRRSSDDRMMSSPDRRESSANSSEQMQGDRRQSAFGSPQLPSFADWRPSTQSEHGSPDMASGPQPPELAYSPRHSKFGMGGANPTQPFNPALLNYNQPHGKTGATSMHEHPMAVSTSLAYGYHQSPPGQAFGSPRSASRRPTLASESSLPSLRHTDSTSSTSQPAGSPRNGSLSSGPSSISQGMQNRELPPLLPSRSTGLPQGLPPMKVPDESSPAPGLATLLRAGEHLASTSVRDDCRTENGYQTFRYS